MPSLYGLAEQRSRRPESLGRRCSDRGSDHPAYGVRRVLVPSEPPGSGRGVRLVRVRRSRRATAEDSRVRQRCPYRSTMLSLGIGWSGALGRSLNHALCSSHPRVRRRFRMRLARSAGRASHSWLVRSPMLPSPGGATAARSVVEIAEDRTVSMLHGPTRSVVSSARRGTVSDAARCGCRRIKNPNCG